MNKVLRFTLIFIMIILALFMFTACKTTGKVVSIEVDPDTIEQYYDVDNFNIAMVFIILTYENEETERIPLTSTMVKAEDHPKLKVVGDHTITVTHKQRTTTFVLKIRDIADRYEVKFFNEDGTQIGQTQFVAPGGTAQTPVIPTKDEHIFNGWIDQRGNYSFYDNINENKSFKATFVPDYCIVKFIRDTGALIKEVKIKKGASAADVAPPFPVIPGKTATGWNRSLDNINEDTTITAVYMDNTINVFFVYGEDGRAPKEVNFPAYTEISPSISPLVDHAEFLGWYTNEDFTGQRVAFPYLLTNEITFYAKYVSRTKGSEGLEYSDTGSNTYTISNYTGSDDVIVIPEKYNNLDVIGVENRAFLNARNTRFYVTDSNNYFSITDGVLFDAAKEKLIAYPSIKSGNQYALPASVKSIENYAFANARNILLINFPSNGNLTKIGNYAFYNCSNLMNIAIPSTVETIGDYAFLMEDDTQMTTFTFTAGSVLQQIGKGAFSGLKKITTITLPSRLDTIGSSAFYSCELLREILIEGGNTNDYFRSVNGVLYDNSFTTLIAYPSNNLQNTSASFTVPDGVTTIKSGAFDNSAVAGLILPATITTLEGDAFNSPRLQYLQFLGNQQPANISETVFGNEFSPAFAIVPEGSQSNFAFFSSMQFVEDSPQEIYYYNSDTGYLYTRNQEHKINILGLRKPTATLVIPSQIDGYDVISIGDYAFYNNHTITDVTISEGIQKISKYAFWKAVKITELSLPTTLLTIENNAFADCISLTTINADSEISLQTLGLEAFIETPWYEKAIDEFLILGNILVKYNGKGQQAIIPPNIKVIADNAFIDKTNLKQITLNDGLEYINSYAFYGCSSIYYIEIPSSIKYIGEFAFSYCPNLYRIIMRSQTPPELSSTGEIFTTDAVYYAGGNVYEFSIVVPFNAASLYLNRYLAHDLWNEYNLLQMTERKVTFESPNSPQTSYNTNTIYQPVQPLDRPGYVFAGWYYTDNVTVQKTTDPIIFPLEIDSEVGLNSRWFNLDEGVSGIEYVLINDETEYAVYRYTGNLKYVVIPYSYKGKAVTKILSGAFSASSSSINSEVYQIILPNTIREIEEGAFNDTKWYNQFLGDFIYINDILIEYRGSDEHVEIPSFINSIVSGAFMNNDTIKSIRFSSNITVIPKKLMYNCINLETVILPANLLEIKEQAFMNCPKLKINAFPHTLSNIASDAFINTSWYNNFVDDLVTINGILYKYKGKQTTLHIPNTITRIEKEAFKDNIFLQNLYISNTIVTIAESAFEGCINIKEVIFAQNANIRYIKERAFYGCLMMEIFNPGDNNIQEIGDYAFSYCSRLSSVNFPSSLIYLGKGAYSESGIVYANFANNSLLLRIEEDTFKNCRNLRSVVYGINSYITSIASGAFENCSNLMSIIIPNTNRLLTNIEMNAFRNCVSLINVTLPTSLMEIGDDAFMNVPYVESNNDLIMTVGSVLLKYTGDDTHVVISKEVAAISKGAFKDNTTVRKIVFEEGSQLFAIGEEAFMNCINLEDINFPLSVSFIGNNAFKNTRWMDHYIDDFVVINDILVKYKGNDYQAIIPNNVRTIGIEAFYGNTKLRNIEVGQNVQNIMARAFNEMSPNSTITMLRTTPPQLDEDNDIVSLIYVENTTIFNNYRENELWSRYVNNSQQSIMVKYIVTFNMGNSNEIFMEMQTNALFEEPIPYLEGFTFIGWYEIFNDGYSPSEPNAYENLISLPYMLTQNITLYAKWIHNQTGTISGEFRATVFTPPSGAQEGRYIIEYTGYDRYVMIPAIHSDDPIIGISKIRQPVIDPDTGLQRIDQFGNPVFLEGNAFANNAVLEELVFLQGYFDGGVYVPGSQLAYILEGAFENCVNLRRIVLPSTLQYIGPNAFKNCVNLEEVIFIGGGANALVIDENAFAGCISLKTITFQDNLTSIGIDAFKGCNSLTSIYMNGDIPPQISNNPFEFNAGLRIYVNRKNDNAVLNAYRAQWADYELYIVNKT